MSVRAGTQQEVGDWGWMGGGGQASIVGGE